MHVNAWLASPFISLSPPHECVARCRESDLNHRMNLFRYTPFDQERSLTRVWLNRQTYDVEIAEHESSRRCRRRSDHHLASCLLFDECGMAYESAYQRMVPADSGTAHMSQVIGLPMTDSIQMRMGDFEGLLSAAGGINTIHRRLCRRHPQRASVGCSGRVR